MVKVMIVKMMAVLIRCQGDAGQGDAGKVFNNVMLTRSVRVVNVEFN